MSEEKKEQGDNKIELTTEQVESLQKDIDDALSKVKNKSTTEIDRIKEEAKKEAEKELQERQEAKAKEDENSNLKKQLEEQAKQSEADIKAIKEKMDTMIASKAVITNDNPFTEGKQGLDKYSDADLSVIEKNSEKLFFDQRLK